MLSTAPSLRRRARIYPTPTPSSTVHTATSAPTKVDFASSDPVRDTMIGAARVCVRMWRYAGAGTERRHADQMRRQLPVPDRLRRRRQRRGCLPGCFVVNPRQTAIVQDQGDWTIGDVSELRKHRERFELKAGVLGHGNLAPFCQSGLILRSRIVISRPGTLPCPVET